MLHFESLKQVSRKTVVVLCVCVQCHLVMNLSAADRCAFVKNTTDCSMEDGFINYVRVAFCLLPPNLTPLTITLCVRSLCVWTIVMKQHETLSTC